MFARLLGPAGTKFSVLAASPLPTSPNPPGQRDHEGVKRLTVEFQNVTNLRCRVLLTPIRPGLPSLDAPQEEALNDR